MKKLIKQLVEISASEAPILSCFVNLDHPRHRGIAELESQMRLKARRISSEQTKALCDAHAQVEEYLANSLENESRSAVIYSRAGSEALFLAKQFEAPLKTEVIVDELPHIYPLIELKDVYHRFVIVITTEEEARILETVVGATTEETLAKRPELRQRTGREWTKTHYRNHRMEREQQFIRDKIRVIEELMERGGYNHLVLAGSHKMVGRLRQTLPARLQERIIGTVHSNPEGGLNPILEEAMQQFANAESLESHNLVEELERAVLTDGLAVSGPDASHEALSHHYADILVIDQEFADRKLRESLVRLAAVSGVRVETVKDSDVLKRLDGVGCLLRYRPPALTHEVRGASAAA
ncbi:MAG: host attachment protein [Verrucomicrobiota bacterium]